jgi:hypothetical protein
MTPTGQTADGTWEVGVRRTIDLDPAEAWRRLPSLLAGDEAVGEQRSVTEGEVTRFAYRRPEWERDSTLQLRVLPASGGRATVAIHHERLPDAAAREAMRERWTGALEALAAA